MAKEAGEKIGSVRIADDVVPVIAALAAAEVEGVVSVDNCMIVGGRHDEERLIGKKIDGLG